MKRVPVVAVLASLLLVCAALGACGDDDDDGDGAKAGATGTFSAAEVKRASKPWNCEPVYDVPKPAPDTKVGFINPGPVDPFVAAWSAGMNDAAELYGVDLKESFLGNYNFAKIPDSYRSLTAFQPDVVGALADDSTGKALLSAAEANGDKVLFLDTKIAGAQDIGLPNAEAGRLMGRELVKAVEPLLQDEWSDRDVVVVTVTSQGCVPCDERVDAARKELEKILPEGTNVKYVELADPAWSTEKVQSRMRDVITANSDAAFVVAPLDDATAAGAFNAVRQAGLEERARLASIGGDNLAISNLQKGSESYVAAIDAKPYCEGWNWLEAALAVAAGDSFDPYPITGVITPDNVDEQAFRLKVKF
jgi:ABC-type sugar transport system substrate-binding protein